ncbi:MAG: glycosyltransferase [bacterium]
MKPRLAYFTVRYPTLTQTFIQREVEGLCRQGLDVHVFPCQQFGLPVPSKAGERPAIHPLDSKNWAHLLSETASALWREPKLALSFLHFVKVYHINKSRSFLSEKFSENIFGCRVFSENFLANLWGCLAALAHLHKLRELDVHMVHGAWATMPATAAAVCSYFLKKPFSFGAHAYDLYRHGGDGLLKEKLNAAAFVHTTTQTNSRLLLSLIQQNKNRCDMVAVPRGLPDLPPFIERAELPQTIRILSVGRLISKKGHTHQIEACRVLKKRGLPFHLKIIGDGLLRQELQNKINSLGLTTQIELAGALLPEAVWKAYHDADLFWHTGIVDAFGDRDGLPNVIPEAMAHGVPVISSTGEGAAEAVQHNITGLIVDVTSPEALATAVEQLAQQRDLRARLARNARQWVEENFSTEKNTAVLANAFVRAIAKHNSATPSP